MSLWYNTCCKTILQETLQVSLSDKMEFKLQKILDENSKMMEAAYTLFKRETYTLPDLDPSWPEIFTNNITAPLPGLCLLVQTSVLFVSLRVDLPSICQH